MDKQAQDERWNKLSQEEREGLMEAYKRNPDSCLFSTRYFGSHNLNPKPPVKEWKDVELSLNEDYCKLDLALGSILPNYKDDKLRLKIKATFKIAKLIDLFYGGMVSEEEWNDCNIPKYSLLPREWMGKDFDVVEVYSKQQMNFISFHTEQQAEEFMSCESNRKLVEQYYMM